MMNTDQLLLEFDRVVENATIKREMLLDLALSQARTKKTLSRLSGLLSLFSAGAITTVIVKYTGQQTLQIIAAISAALSGAIGVFSSTIKEDDTAKIFMGASKYLDVRDRAYHAELKPGVTNDELFDTLGKFIGEYQKLDEIYAKYFHRTNLTFPWLKDDSRMQSAPPRARRQRPGSA